MKRKIYAFLQARTDSTRLPGKVLKNILGKPMIIHELERVSRSKMIDDLILLTSIEKSDDTLSNIVSDSEFKIYRGSKNDVLDRFYNCGVSLKLNDRDVIVRLTGDCPLHDPALIDILVESFLEKKSDYMANCLNPIYPDGLDAEVFTFEALKNAHEHASKPSEREHVTPFIKNSGLFNIQQLEAPPVHPGWRLTVDEPADFLVINKIYEHFKCNTFTFQEMISFLESNPEILTINKSIPRNEGYAKSLQKDKNENNC